MILIFSKWISDMKLSIVYVPLSVDRTLHFNSTLCTVQECCFAVALFSHFSLGAFLGLLNFAIIKPIKGILPWIFPPGPEFSAIKKKASSLRFGWWQIRLAQQIWETAEPTNNASR
jgi:hypothetical protein